MTAQSAKIAALAAGLSEKLAVAQSEANFWRRAGTRWQRWAHRLTTQPKNGLWGDEDMRRILKAELLAARRLMESKTHRRRRKARRS